MEHSTRGSVRSRTYSQTISPLGPHFADSPTLKKQVKFVHAIPDETEGRKLVEGWPSQPQTLGRSTIERIYRGLLDLLGILVSVPFIVLAGIALDRNGKDIEESDWKRIQTSMNVVRSCRCS